MSSVCSPGETDYLAYESVIFLKRSKEWKSLPSKHGVRTADVITCTASFLLQDTLKSSPVSFRKDVLRTASQAALNTTYLLQMGVGSLVNVILSPKHLSSLVWTQAETHRHDSHPWPWKQSLGSSLLWDSHTMTAFVSSKPLSSLGCKLVYYIHRVARSATLCSTCVLSTHQSFLTLIPRSEGRSLLVKSPQGHRSLPAGFVGYSVP